jgi:hypothetical protein
MKIATSTVLVSLSLIAGAATAAPAIAQQAYSDNEYPVIVSESTMTRQQVQEELEAARAAGLLDVAENQYPRIQNVGGTKTRAEVQAELTEYQTAHADAYIAG